MVRMATQVLNLTDDLLASILILLSLTDLGRACTACATFRRIITSPSFLQRMHEGHPPSLLGLRSFFGRFQTVESPHPSAAVARALARAADFRFSFLPNPGLWIVRDARDGRFVLDRDEGTDGTFPRIMVSDPLFRRYMLLPPIPEYLAVTVEKPSHCHEFSYRKCHIFLAPRGEEAAAAATTGQSPSFTVIWMAQCPTKLVAFVFTSASRQWRAIPSPNWSQLLDPGMQASIVAPFLLYRSYAYGCFYWWLSNFCRLSRLLVLDMNRLEFSTTSNSLPVPSYRFIGGLAMVELGKNRRGMFLLDRPKSPGVLQLFCENEQNHGEAADQWVLENEVPLPQSYMFYHMIGDANGTLLLQGRQGHDGSTAKEFCCMSFDFKTLQHQKVLETLVGGAGARALPVLYTGYPPSLSTPTI